MSMSDQELTLLLEFNLRRDERKRIKFQTTTVLPVQSMTETPLREELEEEEILAAVKIQSIFFKVIEFQLLLLIVLFLRFLEEKTSLF